MTGGLAAWRTWDDDVTIVNRFSIVRNGIAPDAALGDIPKIGDFSLSPTGRKSIFTPTGTGAIRK